MSSVQLTLAFGLIAKSCDAFNNKKHPLRGAFCFLVKKEYLENYVTYLSLAFLLKLSDILISVLKKKAYLFCLLLVTIRLLKL